MTIDITELAKQWSSQPKQGYRLAKLCSNQFEDDAVRILKSCHLLAATDRKPGCCRLIRAGDVRRGPQIVGGAHQLAPSDSDGAEATLLTLSRYVLPW